MPPVITFRLLPMLALLSVTALGMPRAALAAGGGDISVSLDDLDDEDDEDDEISDLLSKPAKHSSLFPMRPARTRRVSHFAIKPSARFGVRHAFEKNFLVELFVRDRQGAVDNPMSLRSSVVSGGLETVYKFDSLTWSLTFEAGQGFSKFYEHTTRSVYDLHTSFYRSFSLGNPSIAVVPRVELGYQLSDDTRLDRGKFSVKAPINYQISDTVILTPIEPKLTYEPYLNRPDNRADWIVSVSAGVRWYIVSSTYVDAEIGFENRWSNVHSAEFSRWALTPRLNMRMTF
jgi:hypothetical protein